MKLKDQVHISREENRARKSKQQPQIPLLCKVTNMFHPISSPSSHKWWSRQQFPVRPDFLVALGRDHFWFSECLQWIYNAPGLLCVLGRSRHAVMAAIMLRNVTDAKKWNLWSLWKASKNVSTYCLPTLCWMPTLAVCLGLNVPDRPSYKERKCFGPLKGKGTAFLMWMARLKEIVAGWWGAFRRGKNKRPKEKEMASTYAWDILCSCPPSTLKMQILSHCAPRLMDRGKKACLEILPYPRTLRSTENENL